MSERNSQEKNCVQSLEAGQLWKTEDAHVYIVELGKRIIQYKLLRKPDPRTAVTQMIRIEALANYLRQTEAQLVGNAGAIMGYAARAA